MDFQLITLVKSYEKKTGLNLAMKFSNYFGKRIFGRVVRSAARLKLVWGWEEGTEMESQGVDKSFEKWIRGERLGLGQRELQKRVLVCLFDRMEFVEQVCWLKGRLACGGGSGIWPMAKVLEMCERVESRASFQALKKRGFSCLDARWVCLRTPE